MSSFYLAKDDKRRYELKIGDGIFSISGDYWIFNISDIYSQKDSHDEVLLSEYLGIGKLKMRPFRRVTAFIVFPLIIGFVSKIINHILIRILMSSDMMERITDLGNTIITVLMIAFILYGIRLFFSLQDLIEISFISKHICIPRKSLTEIQFKTLCQSLQE